MSRSRLVWSDELGDMRKKESKRQEAYVDERTLVLRVRRLTSGKGRTVIEITGLPKDKKWCQELAKSLKKALGVGGTYKDQYVEIHGEKLDEVGHFLDARSLKWKKTGG